MSKYQDSILTTAGLQLASKAYAGKTTFKLTRTATTTDVVAADEVKTLMVLPHEAQAGTITQGDSVVSDDHTLITTELLFTNKDLKTGYSINAIGVYALEAGSDKEILYSVAIAEQAEYMPDFADKVLMEFKATITMAVGQISNVTIEMVANNLATQQYVQNAIGAIQIGGTNLVEDTMRTKNTVEVAAGETIVQRKNVWGAMEPGKYLCRVIIENTPCDAYMSVAIWKTSTSILERTVVGNTIKAGESGYSSVKVELGADEFIAYTYIMLNEVQPKTVSCSYRRWKLECGNNYTDWSPSDADMARISLDGSITTYGGKYIPAKDSEVVHDNHDGNIVVNSKNYDITKFQQAAITASDGGPYITVGANEKIVDKLKGLSAGLYTIDINSNNNDLPSSDSEAFGIVERVYIANATTPYYYSVLKLFNATKPNFSTIMFDDGSHRGWDGIDNLAVMIPASKKSGTGLFAFSTSRIRFKSINDVLFVDCFADLAAKPSTNGWLNLCTLPDEITELDDDVQYHYLTGASQGSAPVLFRFDTKAKMLAVMASTTSDVYSASGAIVI